MRFAVDRVTRRCLPLALGMAMLAASCSRGDRPKVVPVTGVITYHNLPVEDASVMFTPIGIGKEKAATAVTDAAGKFQLSTFGQADGAVPGQYKVTVFKSPPAAETGDIENEVDENKVALQAADQELPETEVKPFLPEKYASAGTTLLDANVKDGEKNEFSFELQD